MNGYKYGGQKPVVSAAVATAVLISIGDLVEATSGVPKPAADHTWNTNIATTQEEFHDLFLGVAMQKSIAGDVNPIRVATEGIFEFDCASANFEVGDLVGTAKQTGNGIETQKVVAVATANLAVGRVAKRGTSVTKVWVEIISTLARGGPQTMM